MNDTYRLNSVARDLVAVGVNLPEVKRFSVARAVAIWACQRANVGSVLDFGWIERLLHTDEPITALDRTKVSTYVADFDEKYFSIVEENDGLDVAGEALVWFCRARAMASLHYMFDADKLENFCDSLYEAQAATNDLNGLRALVQDVQRIGTR